MTNYQLLNFFLFLSALGGGLILICAIIKGLRNSTNSGHHPIQTVSDFFETRIEAVDKAYENCEELFFCPIMWLNMPLNKGAFVCFYKQDKEHLKIMFSPSGQRQFNHGYCHLHSTLESLIKEAEKTEEIKNIVIKRGKELEFVSPNQLKQILEELNIFPPEKI